MLFIHVYIWATNMVKHKNVVDKVETEPSFRALLQNGTSLFHSLKSLTFCVDYSVCIYYLEEL